MKEKGFAAIIIIVAVLLLIAAIGGVFIFGDKTLRDKSEREFSSANNYAPGNRDNSIETSEIPKNLSLPFKTGDVDEKNGEVNPLGIIRSSKDAPSGPYPGGHSGIDIPLFEGSNVIAVADGEVVIIETAGDPWGGMKIVQLLQMTRQGEGWAFLYEHVTPKVKKGDKIQRGQVIATKTAPDRFTAHFQMSRVFNDYKYTKDNQCWPEYLNTESVEKLNAWWSSYRQLDHLLDSWRTTQEGGGFPFRGLLDETNYPDGPQLCYPFGTDIRNSTN